MGSIAQEVGHDLIINHFVNRVITSFSKDVLFYIIHPATGPLRDIYFYDSEQKEYASAWNKFPSNYITEYNLRLKLDSNVIKQIKEESEYWKKLWYKNLSKALKGDLRVFTHGVCVKLTKMLEDKFPMIDKLPDVIGINKNGKICVIAEIKFEYLPKKALNEFLSYYYLAKQSSIPFCLVFPKKGSYARTDYNWLKKNLPSDILFYTFEEISEGKTKVSERPIVLPSPNIKFKKWEPL